jgi:UDP-N-acetylglucosamine 2-epimerase (non-hydrolysing)
MKRKRVLVVFGTRPEAIKMFPVINELKKNKSEFLTKTCVTAQHRQMLDQVLNLFSIRPDYDLDIMKRNQSISAITSQIITKMKNVFEDFNPDYVLVHGDTTTSMATSLAAFYKKIKICHVEAGLRTNDLYSPWPEEGNRQIISVLSYLNFAPTNESKKNLLKENKKNIFVTGNTVIDALFFIIEKIRKNKELNKRIEKELNEFYEYDKRKKIVLVTGHRRENFGAGFESICLALKQISQNNKGIDIVYPLHLNPKVKEPVENFIGNLPNVHLINPLSYETFIYLMQKSYLILTDSGGIQEEAPSLGKPVLVMRNISERPEAIKAGTVKLVGTDHKKIIKETQKLLDNEILYKKMSQKHNPYGDAKASIRIINILKKDGKSFS